MKIRATTFDKKLYAFCIILAFLTVAFSGFDIPVSSYFYNSTDGFFLRNDAFLKFFHKDWPIILYGLPVLCIGLWLGGKINKESMCGIKDKTLFFILISGILIPALIVNSLFKNFWGRARPRNIIEFGGEEVYTSPLVISNQCIDNCSFPSGHAAAAFWCLALALVLPKPLRRLGIVLTVSIGILVSYTRIAMGAHFLSDTIFSFVIVVPLIVLLWRSMELDK